MHTPTKIPGSITKISNLGQQKLISTHTLATRGEFGSKFWSKHEIGIGLKKNLYIQEQFLFLFLFLFCGQDSNYCSCHLFPQFEVVTGSFSPFAKIFLASIITTPDNQTQPCLTSNYEVEPGHSKSLGQLRSKQTYPNCILNLCCHGFHYLQQKVKS